MEENRIERGVKKIELLATMTGGKRDIVLKEYENTISVEDVGRVLSSLFTRSLVSALKKDNSDVKKLALSELGRRGKELSSDQKKQVILILENDKEDPEVRIMAAKAAKSMIDSDDVVKALVRALMKKDKNNDEIKKAAEALFRKAVAEALSGVNKKEVVEALLIKALEDKYIDVQEQAMNSLENCTILNEKIDKALIEKINKKEGGARGTAKRVLRERMKRWTSDELLSIMDKSTDGSDVAQIAYSVLRGRMERFSAEQLQMQFRSKHPHPKIVKIATEILNKREEGKNILRVELGLGL